MKRERRALLQVQDRVRDSISAQTIIQQTAKLVQEAAHRQFATIVTRCIAAVYKEPYEFRIEFVRKRGRTEAKLQFYRDGELFNPLLESGGGVVDVAAFALRLATILLSRPKLRRVMILDEPFKHVDKSHIGRVAALLHSLVEELDFQFLVVTHQRKLMTGTVHTVNDDGSVETLQVS